MIFQNKILSLFLLVGLSLTAISSHSFAQTASPTSSAVPDPADSSCDPNYYTDLTARAWLEAQREITQNQNLILKPDSVLQYTCFDKHLGALTMAIKGPAPAGMFSEEASLDAVDQTTKTYINANFSGSGAEYLGQRSDNSYAPAGPITEADYSCDEMDKVWEEVRCMDFIDEPDSDGFFSITEYFEDGQDKRFIKGSCSKSNGWQNNVDALTVTNNGWEEDNVQTFLEKIDPTACSSLTAIETGLQISGNHAFTAAYPERFCIVSGCYNTPNTTKCQSSPP